MALPFPIFVAGGLAFVALPLPILVAGGWAFAALPPPIFVAGGLASVALPLPILVAGGASLGPASPSLWCWALGPCFSESVSVGAGLRGPATPNL